MHLIDLMEFGYKVGVDPSVTDFFEALRAASRMATKSLGARLRYHDFGRYETRKDYFRVPRMFGPDAQPAIILALSRGFVDTTGYTVRFADTLQALRYADTSAYTDLRDLLGDGQSDQTLLEAERGVITIMGADLTGKLVEVAYTGGLYLASDDAYEAVPGWLEETAMTLASINLLQNRALTAENPPDLSPIRTQLADLVNAHGRFLPHALKPMV